MIAGTSTELRAPSACVVLPGGTRMSSRILGDVRRYGFDVAYLVDAAAQDRRRTGLEIECVDAASLCAALRGRLEPDDPVLLISAGPNLDGFNWLDLVPQLASRPRCSAAVAVVRDEGAVAALIKGGVLDTLAAGDPLTDLAGHPDTFTVRYDGATLSSKGPRPAVFFDRDGVINADHGYVGDVSRFTVLPGAIAGVKAANDRGALAFLVTNQSGVARGFFTERDIASLHGHMNRELRRQGAHFDDIRICPHLPDGAVAAYRLACACRKPEPGMLLDLMRNWPVQRNRSVMIGDKESDMAAARSAGLAGVLYRGGSLADIVIGALAGD